MKLGIIGGGAWGTALAQVAPAGIPGITPPTPHATAVYESHFILEWLETRFPSPPLLPADADDRLRAKEIEVVCDGMCDALVLRFFEAQRAARAAARQTPR